MSANKTPIFIAGATGYIDSSVLERLLKHPSASTFDIAALVRNADKAKILESKFGVKAVVGNHQELDKLESLAENAHVIFHTADADDEPAAKAILSGLKKRHAKLGDLPILIHTSGTGVLTDDAGAIIAADTEGYARTHIIFPSTIYAIAEGALFNAGVSNPHSIQIPLLTKAALDRNRSRVVGKGKPRWPNVHIHDVADLYIIARAIGDALVTLGIAQDPELTTFTVPELIKYFTSEVWGYYSGTNSRARADRGRALGWKLKYTTEDMLKSIRPEVEAWIKEQQA
ncbi:NAD-P-binding protein [Trametes meyenii]|nr:NAD-P-binding protein [Trametes meyenii]